MNAISNGLPEFNPDDYSHYLQVVLDTAKRNISADLGYLARFQDDEKIILLVDTDKQIPAGRLQIGNRIALDQSLCQALAREGKPMVVVAETEPHPVSEHYGLPIHSFLAVPVYLADDGIFGAMCFLCTDGDNKLNQDALAIVGSLCQVVGGLLGHKKQEIDLYRERRKTLEHLYHHQPHYMVYQPIVSLLENKIVGVEALSRFDTDPPLNPAHWFREAWEFGLGIDLEIKAIQAVLDDLHSLPEDIYVCINLSPMTVMSQALLDALKTTTASRVVLEITEHKTIAEFEPVIDALHELKKLSVRVAIDDVGTGYSGLYHILKIKPDLIKLDISLTRDVDKDPAKQALVSAVVSFAARIGASMIAEGIESREEADALRVLGVGFGQGYYFARPKALPIQLG